MSKSKPSTPAVQVIAAPADLEEENPWLNIGARPLVIGEGGNITIKETPAPKLRKPPTAAQLAALRPYKPGQQGSPGNPYPISRHLKDILCDPKRGLDVAEVIMRTATLPSSRGFTTALTALLDRTEGKVTDDSAKAPTVNILNVIVKDAETKADLTLLRDMGKPPALTEGVTDASRSS